MPDPEFLEDHQMVLMPRHDRFSWEQTPPNLILLMDALVEKQIVCCPAYNLRGNHFENPRSEKVREAGADGSIVWEWRRHAYGDYVPVRYNGSTISDREIGEIMKLFCHAKKIDYEWSGHPDQAFKIDPGFSDE